MSRVSYTLACRLAVGMIVGLTAAAAAQAQDADDVGIVRIRSIGARTIVRSQSPEATDSIQQVQCAAEPCESGYCGNGACGDGNCQKYAPCPQHGWGFDPNCQNCRMFSEHGVWCPEGSFGHGGWGHGEADDCRDDDIWDGVFSNCGKLFDKCFDSFLDHCGMGENTGPGVPLMGCYKVVYPVNPSHFDGRDGQVYAAQGYGGPVSVPLAPTVHHTYNYGWGLPSSRLTPISHPVPVAR